MIASLSCQRHPSRHLLSLVSFVAAGAWIAIAKLPWALPLRLLLIVWVAYLCWRLLERQVFFRDACSVCSLLWSRHGGWSLQCPSRLVPATLVAYHAAGYFMWLRFQAQPCGRQYTVLLLVDSVAAADLRQLQYVARFEKP
jgi:hypothetical protein